MLGFPLDYTKVNSGAPVGYPSLLLTMLHQTAQELNRLPTSEELAHRIRVELDKNPPTGESNVEPAP
jgi:hypothetical protein